MKKNIKRIFTAVMLLAMIFTLTIPAFAAGEAETVAAADNVLSDKALAAAAGAIGMGWAIAKSAEAISRQPEAENKIRTTLMLGLVFVETAIIYALVIAILIIFVL